MSGPVTEDSRAGGATRQGATDGGRPPERALTPLRFSLLGALAVRDEHGPVAIAGARRRTLAVRLLVERDHTVSLTRLAEDVWGEDPPAGAASTLRSHLSALRKVLGPERLYSRNGSAVLEVRSGELDVELFDSGCADGRDALARGDATSALELFDRALGRWRGPALADVDGQPWALPEIGRLEEQRLGALEGLLDARLRMGQFQRVVTDAEAAVREHPLREQLWAVLMSALYRSGRQADALRAYQRLRHHLAEELGLEPSPALQELELAVLEQRLPPIDGPGLAEGSGDAVGDVAGGGVGQLGPGASDLTWLPSATAPPFVGRTKESALARQARDRAGAGGPAFLVVTGEPGIGKTRLAAEVARTCAAGGDLILVGRCNEDPLSPFEAFRDAFRDVVRTPAVRELLDGDDAPVDALAQVVPEAHAGPGPHPDHAPMAPEAERFQSFEAVTWLLGSLARRRPVVLVLEDLQWADAPALSLLEHVLQSAVADPVLVIATCRDTESAGSTWLAEGLVDLRRAVDVTRIDLDGLSPALSLALVESAVGAPGTGLGSTASRLRDYTGGNPFFLQEVASDLVSSGGPLEGALALEGAAGAGSTIPDRLRELVRWRLGRLSEPCTRVLSVAALIGLQFPVGVLLATCDYSEEDVLAVLDEAQDAGVITELTDSDDTYRFVHDLVRAALEAGFGEARRVRTHLRIARELESRHGKAPGHAPEIARHYVHGIAAGSAERARHFCRLAGSEALARVAYEAAVLQFEQALEITTTHFAEDHATRCELLLLLADAMVKSGRLTEADERFLQAFDEGQVHGRDDVVAAAALGYGGVLPAGAEPSEDGRRLLRTALDVLGPGDSAERALALGRLAHWSHFAESREARELLAGEAIAVAQRLDDPATLAAAVEYRYWALCGPDDVDRQLDDGRRIREIGRAVGDPELVLRGMKCELHAQFEAGDFAAADATAMEMHELAARIGQPEYLRLGFMWDSLVSGIQGRFDDAELSADRAYDIFRRSGHSQSLAIAVGLGLTWLWLQGRMSEMGPILEAGRTGRSSVGEQALAAWVAVESGDQEAAAGILAGLTPESVAAVERNFHWWFMMAGLSHTACSLGDVRWADALYGLIAPFASHNCRVGQASFLGAATFYLGSLARVAGRPEQAAAHLQDALARHRAMGAVPFIRLTERQLALVTPAGGPSDGADDDGPR